MKKIYILTIFGILLAFVFYLLLIVKTPEFLTKGFIFVDVLFLILNFICISKYNKQGLNYFVVPLSILLCLIPTLVYNNTSNLNSGVISFGNYFTFWVISTIIVFPVFLISFIQCLIIYIRKKMLNTTEKIDKII